MERTSQLLSRDDFEFCRRTLLSILSKCDDTEYHRLATLISCMLHCLRPLRRSEIAGIFRLMFHDQKQHCDGRGDLRAESEITRLLDIQQSCQSSVVQVNSSGIFGFSDPRLEEFLRDFPIRGIDRTIRTIVRACVLQAKLDRAQTSTTASTTAKTTDGFGEYTAEMWPVHYRRLTNEDWESRKEEELNRDMAELTLAKPQADAELSTNAQHGVSSDAPAENEWVIV